MNATSILRQPRLAALSVTAALAALAMFGNMGHASAASNYGTGYFQMDLDGIAVGDTENPPADLAPTPEGPSLQTTTIPVIFHVIRNDR